MFWLIKKVFFFERRKNVVQVINVYERNRQKSSRYKLFYFLCLAHIKWHCITRLKAKHIKHENVWNYSKAQTLEWRFFFLFRFCVFLEKRKSRIHPNFIFHASKLTMKERHEAVLHNWDMQQVVLNGFSCLCTRIQQKCWTQSDVNRA